MQVRCRSSLCGRRRGGRLGCGGPHFPTSWALQRDPHLISLSIPPTRRPHHVCQVLARQPSARRVERVQRRHSEERPRPHFPRPQAVRLQGLRGRYIRDFTKTLLGEVCIMINEVGALRDERRHVQQFVCPAPRRRCVLSARAERSWSSWLSSPSTARVSSSRARRSHRYVSRSVLCMRGADAEAVVCPSLVSSANSKPEKDRSSPFEILVASS
jgi:hypothetical protein